MEDISFQVGFGYDSHRLVKGRPLILGGVEIPNIVGLEGHSDADVLTHAIIDAVIGALGMGDIGKHFPDTDPAYKDATSILLLKKAMSWGKRKGYRLNNLDATIVAERPKLETYITAMRKKIAETLEVSPEKINIKATTTEGMGFCGRREGIAAYAILSIISPDVNNINPINPAARDKGQRHKVKSGPGNSSNPITR